MAEPTRRGGRGVAAPFLRLGCACFTARIAKTVTPRGRRRSTTRRVRRRSAAAAVLARGAGAALARQGRTCTRQTPAASDVTAHGRWKRTGRSARTYVNGRAWSGGAVFAAGMRLFRRMDCKNGDATGAAPPLLVDRGRNIECGAARHIATKRRVCVMGGLWTEKKGQTRRRKK